MTSTVSAAQTSSAMRLVVTGAGGRMGKALIRAITENPDTVLSGAIVREGSPLIGQDAGEVAGAGKNGIIISADPLPVFAEAQGVLDFTTPASTLVYAALAAQARIVHVIGTTGCSAADEEKIRAAARHATIIKSGNMSLGVNLLSALVEQAARALGPSAFDIEILEMHHKHKVDAPSGTALLLGEAAAQGRDIALTDHSVRVRDGHTGAREDGTIGFATLRGGSVVGDHSVIFAGTSERITLSHQAQDRSVFAQGAVSAALWGQGKKPGLYTMRDVLGL
ncbi:4-hydroxy-tetrahydrodipicolinate reductase [Pseudochrobactrum sp. sp1633]|uniref:4-hydroxy-tetrahydrodipicolinate reductase n=1 Tax=Pseudochrobactrum sp. sp1633 TaxID=3036706 RepID=UPI0025A5E4D2|nr:4-hydroxy-tetrahydrodipicolinate reductase [Pseudochrobactrum sp. sp1633]MDM8345936.1 4-hydroxy-tetrahydrodipicolinate reductase [Pseudochrobactrum sp. sp1633]HWD12201.1 4-hydroxy-tetrahydrodipicolinate reductase [Pseudochrobactrum sp.]